VRGERWEVRGEKKTPFQDTRSKIKPPHHIFLPHQGGGRCGGVNVEAT